MKLLLGWPDVDMPGYIPPFEANKVDTAATGDDFMRHLSDSYEVIAIHCKLFPDTYPWEWLTAIRRANHAATVLIGLSDKVYSSVYLDIVSELAGALHMELLPIGETVEGGLQAVYREVLGSLSEQQEHKKGRLVTISSSTSKDGATTTAIHVALQLARQQGMKVGLLDLNLKSPDIRSSLDVSGNTGNLLTLRPSCMKDRLHPALLLEHCVRFKPVPSLQLLLGSTRRDTSVDFTLEQMETLLDAARDAFDVVVADVHTFPDNAATVCAVKHADERWIVAQPVYSSFRTSWSEWFECVWRHCGLQTDDFSLIVNRSNMTGGLNAGSVSAAMNVPLLASLPNVGGGAGIRAANEGIPLGILDETGAYQAAVDKVAHSLAVRCGGVVENQQASVKRRPMRKWMATLFS